MDTGGAPNAAMADSWNGPGGQHWVAHADRHDRALAHYGDAVLAAAAVAPTDRVRSILGDAGFTATGMSEAVHPMWLGTDVDDAVAYLRGQPLARSLFEGRSNEVVERALVGLRTALAPHAGPDGVALGGRAWIVTARAA